MTSSTSKTAPTGRVWKFGDHIDTDLIIPARFLTKSDPAFLAAHCMEGVDEALPVKIRPGDIFAAGENFGCGSSREHAPLSIKAAGVRCVIADSFARIFFRNAINIGLPVIEAPGVADKTAEGDALRIDPEKRVIFNTTNGLSFPFQPYPPFLQDIIDAGGLIAAIRKKTKDSPRRR